MCSFVQHVTCLQEEKLVVFLSYTAKYGCSFSKRAFAGGIGSTDYSGFNRNSWPKRTQKGCLQSHLTKLKLIKLSIRLSVLHARTTILSLYCGSNAQSVPKHFLKRVWIEGYIGDHMLDQCQLEWEGSHIKFGQAFSSFTANLWQSLIKKTQLNKNLMSAHVAVTGRKRTLRPNYSATSITCNL